MSTGDTVADDLSLIQLANLLARSVEILSAWPTKLVKLLATRGVKPVSGPSVDGGRLNVFRRADLDGIDLAALALDKRPRQRCPPGIKMYWRHPPPQHS